ncbi:metallophosphoesterase [Cytobacillus sp. FSL M8-0252]|uniref:metallophosphoesterase n=2 Tax=Cytobacillus sp. FSL M8-0252 TaxID=2921621 RepID=UPI0030FBA150
MIGNIGLCCFFVHIFDSMREYIKEIGWYNVMADKMTRRSFFKKSMGSFVALAAIGTGGFFYARDIEPKYLQVIHHNIIKPQLPHSFHNLKVVQFSDTHLGFHYDLNELKKLMNKINSFQPDLILFTGDLMDKPNEYPYINQISPILSKLHASIGKFAIYGNHDHGGYGSDIYREIMEESGFEVLLNESKKVTINNESIYISGIDDAMLGKPNFQTTFADIPNDGYHIFLSHAPDLADEASQYHVDFQFSGHSHGGQIQIPFIGALVKPPFGEVYYEGFYDVGDEKPLKLYVNRGIGTTRLPFRFLCRPELTIFTLKSQ